MTHFIERLFSLPNWAALALVFFFPAAEASIFLGFIFPGELAVLLGGVLAFEGRASLGAVLAMAISGAIVGDSIGYWVGKRYGTRVLNSTLGRFIKAEHIDRGQRYLATKGGKAVFFGRWTAALRAMVPGLAGMSSMPYRKFFLWNAAGGTIWATTFVLLGNAAGNGWRKVEKSAHWVSLLAIGVLLSGLLLVVLVKWVRRRRLSL